MVAEIGWTHNIIILKQYKDALEREFYIRMTRKFSWTKMCSGSRSNRRPMKGL